MGCRSHGLDPPSRRDICRRCGGLFGAAFALFSVGMLSTYGVGFMMFLTAFPLFVGAFAVTQIASEIKGLALDGHCAADALGGRERLNWGGRP